MEFRFDEAKTVQAAVHMVRQSEGTLNYLKLMKLLYFTDREALLKWGRPVTGATYFSMKHGPVLSEVYDLIKSPQERDLWSKHLGKTEKKEVVLICDVEPDDLSDAEINLIDDIVSKFRDYDEWRTVDFAHTMPEWKHPAPATRSPISIEEILLAGGKNESEIADIKADVKHLNHVQARYRLGL